MTPFRLPRMLGLVALAWACGVLQAQAPILPQARLQTLRAARPDRMAQVRKDLLARKAELGLDDRHDLVLAYSAVDEVGQTHGRFDQVYRGVRVWGGGIGTHVDAEGKALPDTPHLLKNIQLDVQPSLGTAEALAAARAIMAPKGPYDAIPTAELVVLPETKDVLNRIWTREGEVPNAAEVSRIVTGYRLAYHVRLIVMNPLDGHRSQDFLLDAHSGQLVRTWDSLPRAETPALGTGRSQYSGTVALNTTNTGTGTFLLKDLTRGTKPNPHFNNLGNAVFNLANGTAFENAVLYTDADNVWGDGLNYTGSASTSTNGQTAAVDAAYAQQVTWDFYKNVLGRSGLDGLGMSMASVVHYNVNYENAAWRSDLLAMVFGDGNPTGSPASKVFTALDITAHEMAHGLMDFTAYLFYVDEAGGLNEANSDIFGTLVEFYARGAGGTGAVVPDTGGNWTIAEDLGATPERYLYKPDKDGYSLNAWRPDLGTYGPHYASGPMNRAFFFLSQGASADPASDFYSSFLPGGMVGIGNQKAARIWYQAITSAYLFPTAQYVDARQASLEAARTLYGATSDEFRAVANAFAAVNVGQNASAFADTARPSVTASVQGTSGPITFSAAVSDNVGVHHVEYWVDWVPFATVTSAPWSLVGVDSTQFYNQTDHRLWARAFDAAGNVGTSPEVVFPVSNAISEGLANGGFEAGMYYWYSEVDFGDGTGFWLAPENINFPSLDITNAHTGSKYFLFGAFRWQGGKPSTQTLYQQVDVPATASTMALTFWLHVQTEETAPTAVDTLQVEIWDDKIQNHVGAPLETLASFSNLDKGSWTKFQLPISASKYAGKTIFLNFTNHQSDAAHLTKFALDDVVVKLGSRDLYKPDAAVGDVLDLASFARAWGRKRTDSDWAAFAAADFNGDGVIDDKDQDIFLKEF
jgi:Zn-dependent metalloprotease